VTTIRTLRDQFEAGTLGKHEYAERMAEVHAILVEYRDLLAASDIAAITVSDVGIVLESRRGPRFAIDPRDRGIPPIVALNFGRYEAVEMSTVLALAADGMSIVDVGANVGWYAVHLGATYPRARVFAFEPVSSSFQHLVNNVALNGLGNVETFHQGLFRTVQSQRIYFDPTIAGAASVCPSGPTPPEYEECPMTTLDAFTAAAGAHVDFLKADVEGAELAVFEGGLRTLERDRPIIYAEMLRKHAAPFGYHPNAIIALLRGLGYRCFVATPLGLNEFLLMDDATTETNFFFLHAEKHAEVIASRKTPRV
jgi:FkbM family methyltransferase